ncbi:MAG: oxidoreductase [Flavobacteriales bacterium]|nr:MAG: oxidoreductase [Flavobacteriales bacterium]
MKSAIIFGATGLTGGHLLQLLLDDARYEKVKVFGRAKVQWPFEPARAPEIGATIKKLEEHLIDFGKLDGCADLISGDDLFCCLGTTIKKAGSQDAFRKVDLELPVKIAEMASKNGVQQFLVVSSVGADKRSSNFYLRTKGEMEEKVGEFNFEKTAALRPSIIMGNRNEARLGESISKMFMPVADHFLLGSLKKYRSIHADTIAKAMVEIANGNYEQAVFESDEIAEIGK